MRYLLRTCCAEEMREGRLSLEGMGIIAERGAPRTSAAVSGGVSDARTAWQLHTTAGGRQSAPVFFSVDDDIYRDSWNNLALQ